MRERIKEMKRTLLHITEVSSGGVLPVIANISNGLIDKYNIVVAYGIRFDTPSNLKKYFDSRVKLIPVKSFTRNLSLKKDIDAMNELKAIVKDVQPDVIHMHSTKAGLVGRVGLFFFKGEKYYTPHGYCFLKKDDSILKRGMYYIAEKTLTCTKCVTIACGKREFELAKKLDKKAKIANNGIDIKHIDNILENGGEEAHRYTVYTAGRIGAQKNPSLFNEIAKSCPNINFVWIGDGENEDKSALVSKNILVTGFVDKEQVICIAKNCDCYISCSLWEGLPMALLEAMYMGKPCIVSDVIGNNDLVIDGDTGRLAHSKEEFILYIQEACYKQEKYNNNAHELVKKEYTIDAMCSQYEKIYM